MFIGHYAVSFAFKAKENKASLALLFIAVQFIDILFFPLTLMGIEKFNLIENYTQSTHFQLAFMPYSHSLLATLLWALLVFLILIMVNKSKTKITTVKLNQSAGSKMVVILMALAVISHWLLDFIVHTPDLPLLINDAPKVGLGLWNNALLTYLLEAVLVLAGLFLYMRSTQGKTKIGLYGMPVFVFLLLMFNIVNIFGPLSVEDTNENIAVTSIIVYFVLALIAYWLDKKRMSITR